MINKHRVIKHSPMRVWPAGWNWDDAKWDFLRAPGRELCFLLTWSEKNADTPAAVNQRQISCDHIPTQPVLSDIKLDGDTDEEGRKKVKVSGWQVGAEVKVKEWMEEEMGLQNPSWERAPESLFPELRPCEKGGDVQGLKSPQDS